MPVYTDLKNPNFGEFPVWHAARAVGDHDINNFLLRMDPLHATDGVEPGMTVWIEESNSQTGRAEP